MLALVPCRCHCRFQGLQPAEQLLSCCERAATEQHLGGRQQQRQHACALAAAGVDGTTAAGLQRQVPLLLLLLWCWLLSLLQLLFLQLFLLQLILLQPPQLPSAARHTPHASQRSEVPHAPQAHGPNAHACVGVAEGERHAQHAAELVARLQRLREPQGTGS
jgi:hypothetical protein